MASFKKGECGNKKGAPHAYETFKAIFRKYGIQKPDEIDKLNLGQLPAKDVAVIMQIKKAILGELNSMTVWSNREDGMPKQIQDTNLTVQENPILKQMQEITPHFEQRQYQPQQHYNQ